MNTAKRLIDAAKTIQPCLENFAGGGGGARVWVSSSGSLHALVWTTHAENVGLAERQVIIWQHLEVLPRFIVQEVTRVTVLTPDEYEERYFFTKPPFCKEG